MKMEHMIYNVLSTTLTIAILLPRLFGIENSCSDFRWKTKHVDKYLIGHELDIMVGLDHHTCVRECMTLKVCESTDYISSNATCKLNDANSSSVNLSEFLHLPGAIYSDIEVWPTTMVDKCGPRQCTMEQKCYPAVGGPYCIDIDCGNPWIIHGTMTLSVPGKTLFRDSATVQCQPGYYSNQSSVKCLLNTTWETASCIRKDCGNPPVIQNGTIVAASNKTKFKDSATVQCDIGFTPSQPTVNCLSTQEWKNASCIIKDCGNPPVIVNGTITLAAPGESKYGDSATVKCDLGYRPSELSVTCLANATWTSAYCIFIENTDCKEILDKNPDFVSGTQYIRLWQSQKLIQVYCDMETDGGGWTVFQRRFDGTTHFYRGIQEYRDGFGSIDGEFWLGLTNIKEIADQSTTVLRIDMTRGDGTTGFELDSNFRLEGDDFILYFEEASTTGFLNDHDMKYTLGMKFSAYDFDVDERSINCAEDRHSAWWHRDCTFINLNGLYCTPGTPCSPAQIGFHHSGFDSTNSLKGSVIMLRRV